MTSRYVTEQDLVDRFGMRPLTDLTDEQRNGQPDWYAIGAAILDASAEVDGYIGTKYQLPLSLIPNQLASATAQIVWYKLHKHISPEDVRARYDDAIRWLRDVSAGKAVLPGYEDSPSVTGSTTVSERTPRFTDEVFGKMVIP